MTGRVLRDKGGFLSPVISVVTLDGRPAVLKDYRGKNALTRLVDGARPNPICVSIGVMACAEMSGRHATKSTVATPLS